MAIAPEHRIHRFGSFQLEVTERRLRRGDETVPLPPRAFDVLVVLVEHAGSLVTKEQLLAEVWAGTTVEEANLAVAVSTLRRALGRELIETIPKHGYRFAAKMDAAESRRPPTPEPPVQPSRFKLRGLAAAAATALFLAAAMGLPGDRHGPTPLSAGGSITFERLTYGRDPATHVSARADGRLVFRSERDGNSDIYLADADGSNLRRLTTHPGHDEFPRWSPDGGRIAFAGDRGSGMQIFIMSPDGTDARAVTQPPSSEPAWSPDGRRLAFRRDNPPEDGRQDIYTVASDGTDVRRLTHEFSNEVSPAWSPDGSTIAFAANRGENEEFDLFLVDSGGGESRPLSTYPGHDGAPAWSPDGSELAFVSTRAGGAPELYVMQVAAGGTRRIAAGDAEYPSWSRDGASLLYASRTPGSLALFRASLDAAVAVAADSAEVICPTWSPDGRSVIFTSNRDGKRALFRLDEWGGAARKLTDGKANDWFPSWAPDGRRIVFQSDRIAAGRHALCVMELDSAATRCFDGERGTSMHPAWSPDGTRIAFQSNRDGGPEDFRIYTVAPDGTGLTRLTSGPGYDADPAWSPDGARIAYASRGSERRFAVFTMKSDGTDVRLLVHTKHHNKTPWWSPDGRWIVYTDWRTDGSDLFVVPSMGGAPIRLTYRNAVWPRWNPRGGRLIFTSDRLGRPGLFLFGLPEEFSPPEAAIAPQTEHRARLQARR